VSREVTLYEHRFQKPFIESIIVARRFLCLKSIGFFRFKCWEYFFLFFFTSFCSADEIQGQKQMVVIDDTFQFIPGTWATYTVHDKQKNEEYEMTFSVMEDGNMSDGACSWMEVVVKMKQTPTVVTRFLARKTKQGPGEVLEAIVQMEGYTPFTVPHNFLTGEDAEVGQTLTYHLAKKVRKKSVNFQNRKISLWLVEAISDDQQAIQAWVSEELPPMGIFKIDTSEVGMYLDDWGTGAQSEVTGTPMNFYLWITSQISKALIDEEKK